MICRNSLYSKRCSTAGTAFRDSGSSVGQSPEGGSFGRLALAGVVFAALFQPAHGQEIPRPSAARQKAKTSLPSVSNFKVGEVLMRVDATMTTEFNDNINLQPNGQSDIILSPQIGITTTWAATKLNTLRFRTSLGYAYYVDNQNLNQQQLLISPDSALSFDIYTGDFRINLRDQFSLQQDPGTVGAASGVAQLGRFSNTIGISILWDTNDVIWSLGYNHSTLISLDSSTASAGQNVSNFAAFDNSTDQASASSTIKLSSAILAGIETTANSTKYPSQPQSDFTSYSLGTFFEVQLTRYTHMNISGGYNLYQTGALAPGASTQDPNASALTTQNDPSGFYAGVSFIHRLNRHYSDRLEAGISNSVTAFSGYQNTAYARYSGNWQINGQFSLGIALAYENVDTLPGTFFGVAQLAPYRIFTASFNTGYRLTAHVGLSLAYQFIDRQSDVEAQSFLQNRTTISVGYRF